MRLTKEKVLALVAFLVAALVVSGLRPPRVEEVPAVPAEEAPRPYRTIAAAPRLTPEKPFRSGQRDPFAVEDPWKEAAPALLSVPPAATWPRALPVGPAPAPRTPHDRLLVPERPKAAAPGQGGGQ